MQTASTTQQFTARAITAAVAVIFAAAAFVWPSLTMSQNSEPYHLIFEMHGKITEITGAIILKCRDSYTAEEQDMGKISFFLNHSSVADPSLRERGDITAVEVDRYTIKFNLTRSLKGNYTCGRRVNSTHVIESQLLTLVCRSKEKCVCNTEVFAQVSSSI